MATRWRKMTPSEDLQCPICGGHIATAVGLGWIDAGGQVQPWVGTCIACNMLSSRPDTAFGIDSSGNLVNVEPFATDDEDW